MIPVEYLHYSWLHLAEELNSSKLTAMFPPQRDFYLNKGIRAVNNTLIEFEGNSDHARNLLQPLTIRDVKLTLKTSDTKRDIYTIPEDCYKIIRRAAIATREGCGTRPMKIRRLPSNKIETALESPNWRPSWEYGETIASESHEGFHIWKDDFDYAEVRIDYIKKVPPVRAPEFEGCESYKDEFGNSQTSNVDLSIDSMYLADRYVTVAVWLAQGDDRDLTAFQIKLQQLLNLGKAIQQ